MFDINGKKIIITGGSRGLGFSMAEGLFNYGAEIVLVASNEESLKNAANKLDLSGEKVKYVAGDLSNEKELRSIFDKALDLLGGHLDVLVNCAGLQYRCEAVDFPIDKWDKIMAVNLTSTFVLSQLAAKKMMESSYGKIINIASMTSFFGSVMVPAYSASKGAVMQLTKALSNEWASKGIRVNAIAPGYMITELTDDMKEKNPKQYEEITNRIPMHRWGEPKDMQGIVIFLSSSASDYITGAIIPVDGGFLGK